MNKKIIYRIINILCLVMLVGTIVWLIVTWDNIPDEVPMHFNAGGEIDRMGDKVEIIVMPIFSWLLYGIMAFIEAIPGAWNTGVKVTPENSARVYAIIKRMLVTIKFVMVLSFTMITVFISIGKPLPVWFLAFELICIFGPMVYNLISLYRNR